jgi:FMN phosphatase YigB (HAD superfamily)
MKKPKRDLVFLFDVDNTLLDNDRVQEDLYQHLFRNYGPQARGRYIAIFEELREEIGYADYLGALERYRLEHLHDPRLLRVANWLVDYPFPKRLYPHVFEVIHKVKRWGQAVILSDGDAVFQPRKIFCSGLWRAFGGHVLIFIHKERMLNDVESMYPARHYVMIDDKLRILQAIKKVWKSRVTTVFPKQGHYAHDPKIMSSYPPADIKINRIGDLLACQRSAFVRT